jgi:hypothetical protein
MYMTDLFPNIRTLIKEGLDKCASTIHGFCLHVHIVNPHSSEHPEFFEIQLSTSYRPSYGHSRHTELVSRLNCWIQKETYQGKIMLEVMPERMSTTLHFGERPKDRDRAYDLYDHSWRHGKFCIGAEPSALWCLLEQNADLSLIVRGVLND